MLKIFLAAAGFAASSFAAVAAPVTYSFNGAFATGTGTGLFNNGNNSVYAGGSIVGSFTIDDGTFAISDFDIDTVMPTDNALTFPGDYDSAGPALGSATGVGSATNAVFNHTYPAAGTPIGRQNRLTLTLDGGSSWGDNTVSLTILEQVRQGNGTFGFSVGAALTQSGPLSATTGEVPLPAAAWMLVAALGGLGLMRRARS